MARRIVVIEVAVDSEIDLDEAMNELTESIDHLAPVVAAYLKED